MEFTVNIKVDNDAYRNQTIQFQLIDNLKDIISKLEDGYDYGNIKDINGNIVGIWGLG